ncbi:PPP1R7 isoform 20, partial [Pan troglodytes]
DIASNRIKKIENISHLTELQEFWMNDNLLESWSDLDELKGARSLETVYLERNPLQKDPQYRRKVMLALPSVRQIDATFVRALLQRAPGRADCFHVCPSVLATSLACG